MTIDRQSPTRRDDRRSQIRLMPGITPGSRSTAAIRSSPGVTAAASVPRSRLRVPLQAAACSTMDAATAPSSASSRPSGAPPALAVGAEIDPRIVIDCRRRFAALPGVRFVDVTALGRDDEAGSYDAIFCMEVLEHVDRPAAAAGAVRAPAETTRDAGDQRAHRNRIAGAREAARPPRGRLAAGLATTRDIELHARELVASVFAGSTATHAVVRCFTAAMDRSFHDHKGFNWRVLRAAVAARFDAREDADLTVQLDGPAPGHAGLVRGTPTASQW